jgi:hypothetical protein
MVEQLPAPPVPADARTLAPRTTRRRPGRPGRPGRLAGVTALVALTVALGACGSGGGGAPARTVTVEVDAPGGSASGTGTPAPATPSAVPTQRATPAQVPTSLAVGRQRGAPHSYEEAKDRVNRTSKVAGVTSSFQSPSGNIVCVQGGGATGTSIACEVAKGRIAPPLPTICAAGGPRDIGRIELRPDGAVPVCNSDTIRTGTEPTLAYGTRTRPGGPVGCVSEEFGVTCVDASARHGFFLARDTFVTF